MGRDAIITYEQVSAIANEMKLVGAKPTSRNVRDQLGNVGSMGTINKLLNDWKASQERQIVNQLALPATLQRAILEFMDQELTSAKAELETKLADAQQEMIDLATENERQASDIENKDASIADLSDNIATLKGRLAQLSPNLSTSKADCDRERAAAESARTELAKVLLRLESMPRLEADLTEIKAQLEQEHLAKVAAERLSAVQASQLEGMSKNAEKSEKKIEDFFNKIEALQNQIQQQAQELGAAKRNANAS